MTNPSFFRSLYRPFPPLPPLFYSIFISFFPPPYKSSWSWKELAHTHRERERDRREDVREGPPPFLFLFLVRPQLLLCDRSSTHTNRFSCAFLEKIDICIWCSCYLLAIEVTVPDSVSMKRPVTATRYLVGGGRIDSHLQISRARISTFVVLDAHLHAVDQRHTEILVLAAHDLWYALRVSYILKEETEPLCTFKFNGSESEGWEWIQVLGITTVRLLRICCERKEIRGAGGGWRSTSQSVVLLWGAMAPCGEVFHIS